ncbi:hypothetical protein [Nonlabens ponticola]|uniref:PEP-CTERM sorting domain-containing protein n=1 Tax=Nonlabens ponticola TaxID=2496866 RepID=A0A3S9MZX9_9FLAO|nr:hypothetical protein [Nonlabens ponticola]AZQ44684.1 hypothetical protein EJ995_10695 [Nonlabens ponticola]
MKSLKLTITACLLFVGMTAMAQPSFEEDVNDTEAAPIPGIAYAMAAGMMIGVARLYKKK